MKDNRVMSLGKRSKEETPQNLTPKSIKDMAAKVLKHNKTIEMFKAMAIFNLKMGNLRLEVQSLNYINHNGSLEKQGL
jgi:hypothetical protein